MRRLSESKPMEGLELVNPKIPQTRYLASKKFVMVEFDVNEGKEYVSVYLRPYEVDKTLLTAYLPELEYLEDIRVFNKPGFIKFLSRSNTFAEIYKSASIIPEKPFLSKVQDFTETNKNVNVWCIQIVVNLKLTPKIINEDFPEYLTFEKGVNDIVAIAVEYLKIRREHLSDLNYSYWVKKVNPSLVKSVINTCEKDGFYGTLFNKIECISDSSVRDYIRENKVVIWCKNQIYAIGVSIDIEEDKECDAKAIILAVVFEKSLKDSGYIFIMDLEYRYGTWRPKANVGELVKGVSIILNHVNTKKWAKIEESAYKSMPEATDLWYYSNPYHEGTMLHRFIEDDDRKDYNVDEPIFVVKEPDYITCNWGGVDCNDPWNDIQSFNYLSSVLALSLKVISEFQHYFPIWKKKTYLDIGGTVGKILINPYKYIFKKIFGLD